MSPGVLATRRFTSADRPTYQWEPARDSRALLLRLFGALGPGELAKVAEAVRERCRSPRDLVCISFEDVTHVDFRALHDFTSALARQRYRGASIWLVGLSPYVRALFQVAGQEPVLNRLLWQEDHGPALRAPGAGAIEASLVGASSVAPGERWARVDV